MNGRLYDPKLHRFLSPDNFVQTPFNTQNYNRYAYVMNNPLVRVDKNGEFIHLIIGAAIGGVVNWFMHGAEFSWKGLGYFGVGAASGALGAGVGAGVSSALAGGGFGAGFVGSSVAMSVGSGFMSGAVVGASGGAAGGFASGFGNGLLGGQGFWGAVGSGLKTGLGSAIGGGITGGIFSGLDAMADGRNFWTGAGEGRADYMMLSSDNSSYDRYTSTSEMRADYNSNLRTSDGLSLEQVEAKLNTSVSLGGPGNLPAGDEINADGLILSSNFDASGNRITVGAVTLPKFSGGVANRASSKIFIAPRIKGYEVGMRKMAFRHEFMHAYHVGIGSRTEYYKYSERGASTYSYAYTRSFGFNYAMPWYKGSVLPYPYKYGWPAFNKIISLW